MNTRRMMMQSFGEDLTQNVVAYYRLDGNPNDFFGRLNGNEVHQVNYTTGLVGQAYDGNNGPNSRISIPDNDLLSFTDGVNDLPFSFSFWFQTANIESSFFLTKRLVGSADQNEYHILYNNGDLMFFIFSEGTNANRIRVNYPISFNLNEWYHLAVTYDGSEYENGMNMYLNNTNVGIKRQEGTYIKMANTEQDLLFSSPGSFHLNGLMDEVVIFNKELNQGEITEIYNKGLAGEPLYT